MAGLAAVGMAGGVEVEMAGVGREVGVSGVEETEAVAKEVEAKVVGSAAAGTAPAGLVAAV